METLRRWLNGDRSYQVGVKLYLIYGDNQLLKNLFTQEHETAYKKQRLLDALQNLLRNKTILEEPGKEIMQANPLAVKEKVWPLEPINDPVIKALKEQWKPLYAEMMNLCHRLFDIQSDPERGQSAHRILDLDDQCDEIYAKRDHYLIHQSLPTSSTPDVITDFIKWPQKLANAQRYVREYRIKCKNAPKNERYAAKLQEYDEEVRYYKKLLKIETVE